MFGERLQGGVADSPQGPDISHVVGGRAGRCSG
jgi:hypothetical protein